VAWDPDFDLARQGQKAGVADRFTGSAPEAVRQAGAVFLALPPETLRDALVAVSPHLSAGAVVCALDEGQERATALAAEVLPGNVSFVAAHPILWERLSPDGPRGADHRPRSHRAPGRRGLPDLPGRDAADGALLRRRPGA
jgi:Prephenate dehydrogenase